MRAPRKDVIWINTENPMPTSPKIVAGNESKENKETKRPS